MHTDHKRAHAHLADPWAPHDLPGPCDAPGCTNAGDHRAPRDREHLHRYYWFCLEHVRLYNAAWNYYDGMSESQIEAEIRRDTVWRRPTWRLGAWRLHRSHDPFGLFEDEATEAPRGTGGEADEALAVLKLRPPVSTPTIKARYKELVKRLHPDTNGGDKSAEEQLKDVNRAYATLMQSVGA